MSPEEAALARQALRSAEGCARRLTRSHDKLFPQFRLLVAIRNRIAHSYPDDPGRQAANLNAAYETVPDLLAAHETVRRYLERRLPEG